MVVVGQLVVARVEHPAAGIHDATVQTGNSHRRLDGRPRRVQATQHAVEQRPIDRIAQFGIGLEADAGDEQVGVEARLTHHRQYLAGARVERNHCTTPASQGGFSGLLQLDVQAQHNVLARLRVGALEHPQHPATSVGLDFLVTHLTVQGGLVEALDAGLADMVGTAVVHRVERFQLFLVDPPYITHRMGKMRTLRVMPHQLGHHLDTRQAELVYRHAGNLLFVELEQNRHRLEWPAALAHALLEQGTVVSGELKHFDDGIQHFLPVTRTFAGHRQAEAGPVVGDDHPVAVEDQPAGRRDRLHMHPVVLRQRRVIVVLDDLQVVQPRDQHANEQHDRHCADHDAVAHQAGVFLVVLETDRLRHRTAYRLICGKGARTTRSRRGRSARR
ncbi:hypothetical protein D3C79_525370 [compost metagenome]